MSLESIRVLRQMLTDMVFFLGVTPSVLTVCLARNRSGLIAVMIQTGTIHHR